MAGRMASPELARAPGRLGEVHREADSAVGDERWRARVPFGEAPRGMRVDSITDGSAEARPAAPVGGVYHRLFGETPYGWRGLGRYGKSRSVRERDFLELE